MCLKIFEYVMLLIMYCRVEGWETVGRARLSNFKLS